MQKVFITHNPYKVISTVKVNGEDLKNDSTLIQFLDKRFQLWVDQIPTLLANEYNDDAFEITFHGTEPDYQDLLAATKNAEKNGIHFVIKKIPAKEFGDKEKSIKELFEKIKKLPFDELQSPALEDAFNKASSEEFEVNVTATMSAGKSTLINALLGQKLMPSKQGACTATITRIKDDDDKTFKATVIDANGNEIGHYSVLDYKAMSTLNSNPEVSEIHVSGDIPFVTSDEASLVLVDTPGPNNARNANHKIVTNKALDQSSKSLVLFVMNGSTLNDTAQDYHLKRIAKSMSVDGKQSRERFLFVVNKLDDYNEEDDSVASDVIKNVTEYLEEMGIKEPNIFPAAALPALLVRRYKKSHDDDEKRRILRELKPRAEKLVDEQQLHLEQYPKLVGNSQIKIDRELQEAIEANDIFGQALIHSGIRGIEETIMMYVTKYCRPQKIASLVATFKSQLESTEAFENTKKVIASRTDEISSIKENIDKLNEKLTSKKENEAFKRRISSLEITTKLKHDVSALAADVEETLTDFSYNECTSKELDEDYALEFIKNFKSLAENKGNEFQIAVDRLLDEDIKEKGEKLLNEYVKRLSALSEEFSTDDFTIDLTSFVKGRLAAIKDADEVIDDSIDSRTETHSERRTRIVTKERKWYNPMRLFKGKYYDVEESYYVDVTEEIKFVSREKLLNSLISPIRQALAEEQIKISEFADDETKRIKEYFYDQFDEVDEILSNKAKELSSALVSKEAAEEALKQANNKLSLLESINRELDSILEI
jgi:GTPase Era involved in 16S rRNA processing